MGQNTAELKREISETRKLLEFKVDELTGKVRQTTEAAKEAGTKVAIVTGVVIGVILVSKLVARRKRRNL